MKHFLTILFCFISFNINGQYWDFEQPDYDHIEKNITKKTSPLFYETLMNRFLSADTTMSIKEKRHLYYGYSFQDTYKPYGKSKFVDSLNILLEGNSRLDSADYVNIMLYTDSILNEFPFNLSALNSQLYVYDKRQEYESFNAKFSQVMIILDAILSSGNGITKEESFYVLFVSHEYPLLEFIGFTYAGEQSLRGNHDYLKVTDNESEIEGLYFDISPCLNSLMKSFTKE